MLLTLNAENPSKAIAYVRVSSQRQVDEGVSIEAQVKRIREYARYKGMDIDDKDIIIEEGVSGGVPIWERPGGRHLKTRLKTGAYPHILTMRLDRMFRLVTDALVTVDELADSGISLHVVDMDGAVYSNKINWQVYRKKRELCVTCTQKWVANNRPQTTLPYELFIEIARLVHGDSYSYHKNSYTNSRSKISMTHLVCGITESRMANSHLQGAGCTKCADYGFDRQAPADYYVHAIIQEGNNEIIAYKAGIAGDWRQRIQTLRRHLPDGLRIANLSSIRFSLGQDAWDFEQSLLKIGSIRHKVLDFQGGTELFNINPLDYAKSINLI